ncbi:hypothetical protein ID866_13250 [Astraeus odoratus]|nr:hypothetical protein ID866_13250 [Astraeus odoratus]
MPAAIKWSSGQHYRLNKEMTGMPSSKRSKPSTQEQKMSTTNTCALTSMG